VINNGSLQGWQGYKLGEVAEVQTGPFGSQLHMRDYKSVGTPIVTVEHIGDNRILHSNLPLVGEEDRTRLNKYSLKTGDIVFSRVGSVDRCAFVHETENGWMFSGRLLRVRSHLEKVDPCFLSFYFSQESFKETIRMIAVGATMPSINTSILSEVDVFLPPLPEQHAIAGVLSSLDDKIDLLHRQNKTLEGIAEALWQKMFVEEPDPGWQKGKLEDLVTSIETGKRPKGGIDPNLLFGVPSIGAESINGVGNYDYYETKYVTEEYYNSMRSGKVQNYDILIYKDGAYIGKKSMFANGFPFEKCCINEHVFILRTGKVNVQLFLYFTLEQEELEQLNANSAQPGLNQTALKSFELTIPPDSIINRFGEKTRNFIDKIFSNSIEIRTLSRLRDTLLPKLMSGEVRVKV